MRCVAVLTTSLAQLLSGQSFYSACEYRSSLSSLPWLCYAYANAMTAVEPVHQLSWSTMF